jgi:hypothetical protein
MRLRRPGLVLAGVVACLGLGTLAWVGAREPRQALDSLGPSSSATTTPLRCPPSVSLGRLQPGESSLAHLSLSNPTSVSRTVARVETSCECVHVDALPIQIAPHESRSIPISYCSDQEHAFRGKLAVELIGRDERDDALFRSRADVEIRDSPPSRPR